MENTMPDGKYESLSNDQRKQLMKQEIKEVKINFSEFICTTVLKNTNALENYKSIGVDRKSGNIIIISKSNPDSEQSNKVVYNFKIFNQET